MSCFVSHTSSLLILHLRIPGTNETGCLVLRNSKETTNSSIHHIFSFMLQDSRISKFYTKDFQHHLLYEYGLWYNLHMITKFHTYCTSIYINANCSMMNSILSGDMKLVWQAEKTKSILNTAFRKKLMRYVFIALQNVKPCGM